MNFDQWKKLSKRRQREIAKNWDTQNGEGREIAEAVLKAFIGECGSNKGLRISEKIARGASGWAISVQCPDNSIIPKSYMGIAVGWHYIGHVDDGVSFREIPQELWLRA